MGENEPNIMDAGVEVLLGSDHYRVCAGGKVNWLSGKIEAVEKVFG